LKYQACDKAACYPPRQLPVDFQINVAKGSVVRRRNPGQSPHVHRWTWFIPDSAIIPL